MRSDLITLADALRAQGYETAAFTSSTTTRSVNTGLQRGFDRYVDSLVPWSELFGRDEFQNLIFFYLAGFTQRTQIAGEVVTNRALRWLKNRGQGPFFVWLHYFDPHHPFGSPPPFRDMYKGRVADGQPMAAEREHYAEDITYADHHLGRLIDALKQNNLYERTLIVVTSDHGEAFGEKHALIAETGHGHYLSDITQRVPLVIKQASGPAASATGLVSGEWRLGRRVSEQVELVDLAPTILGLLKVDAPPGFCGSSFAGLLDGQSGPYEDRYAHAFTVVHVGESTSEPGASATGLGGAGTHTIYLREFAIRSEQWKYVARPRLEEAELYDLLKDPQERENVADEHPDVVGELHALILPLWNPQCDAPGDPRQGISPALVRELQALGYLGGSGDD